MTTETTLNAPLRLFWWNNAANFGDSISHDIVAHLSGREVEWAGPAEADIFALGSIVKIARHAHARAPCASGMPWIWGSGCMDPVRTDFVDNVQIATLRGPISAELLGLSMARFGDPGLLISDVVDGCDPAQRRGVGIVPHHGVIKHHWSDDFVPKGDGYHLIDPRGRDHLAVVRDISSCEVVISSSLHGLIVADSFGIPNFWMDPTGNHKFSRLKFYDYALGVGRVLGDPVAPDAIEQFVQGLKDPEITYSDGLNRSREHLHATFPDALRG